MRERLKKDCDPAYVFSSLVHGEPATPILETYPGDELMIRLLDGAHEEQHVFNIHITKKYGAGDYLYYFGGVDDAWLGLWGIIRVYHHPKKCLKPLCKGKNQILPLPPCPGKDAVIRKYEIAAIQTDIKYNCYGDHDPNGLIFVPMEELSKASNGCYQPIPYFDYSAVPLDQEQTVGVGGNKKYLWYAYEEYGACLIQSFGDMRNHRYHGLFGAILIEPAGAKWYRTSSLAQSLYDEQAVITAPGEKSFRDSLNKICT